MIRCRPRTIFSWDFRVEGEGSAASLEVNWLSEQGTITSDRTDFEINKHGVFSGRWTMEANGQTHATAQKATAFRRTFEISSPTGELSLIPESMFTRRFRLEREGKLVARICPDHPFTRRSKIELRVTDLDFPTICFAFWLVLITWRRSNGDSSGGGA